MEAKRPTRRPGEDGGRNGTWEEDGQGGRSRREVFFPAGPRRFESAALIVNTRSRVGRNAATAALDYLGVLGVPVRQAFVLDDPYRLPETVREILTDGHDLVVLGGGDGSISSVAGVVAESDAALGVLPLGTANDFARTLGIPFELGSACVTVADGAVARVDLGFCGQSSFVNVASVGLGAAVAEAVSPRLKRAVGPLAYPAAAFRAYLDHEPFEAGFVFPDGDHEGAALDDLMHVAVGNGRYYGGGMVVAPGSDIEDHALDVFAIEARGISELARIAWNLRRGEPAEGEHVHHWRTRRVWVLTEPRLPINVDGELIARTPKSFSVSPDALKVLVPQDSPTSSKEEHRAAEIALS